MVQVPASVLRSGLDGYLITRLSIRVHRPPALGRAKQKKYTASAPRTRHDSDRLSKSQGRSVTLIAIVRNPHPLDFRARHRQTRPMNSIFKRLFLADFWKGLILTFRTQNPKNIYTEQYPLERPMVAERYRGAPRLNMNPDTGETLCIACNLCSLACPENLIVVGWHRDDATRRKVLTTFTYDTSRCMFCGLCEDACPTDCLELTQDFEMASYSREGAIWDRHRLEEGPTPARYTR